MDGLTLTKHVRALEPAKASVPIILLTGETEESLRIEGLSAGASAFIRKPITAQQLRDVIAQVMPKTSP
jgi:two-component system, chemotaxis family, chemotaxis protein CheY